MFALSVSTHFDWRLALDDLDGSIAHAAALHRAGLLTDEDHEAMVLAALQQLRADVAARLRQAIPATRMRTVRWSGC